MRTTIHRRDIRSEEFTLLARFCWALQHLDRWDGKIPYALGKVVMRLPLWQASGLGWRLNKYKNFTRYALGIEVSDFRRICRYLQVGESQMIKTLYRLSMLSAVRLQMRDDKPKFKMTFTGVHSGWDGDFLSDEVFGFVIEKRRAEGHFR